MWFTYVGLSGWWSLRQNEATAVEKLFVFIAGGCAIGVPALVFSCIAAAMPVHSGWELEQTAAPTEETPVRSNTHYHGRGQKTNILRTQATKELRSSMASSMGSTKSDGATSRGGSQISRPGGRSIGSRNASQVNRFASAESFDNGRATSKSD